LLANCSDNDRKATPKNVERKALVPKGKDRG